MTQSREERNVSIAIIAIVAALALLGVVVLTVVVTMQLQQAEALGCPDHTPAFNASNGRCRRA